MDSTSTLKIQKKLTLVYWKEKNFWLENAWNIQKL